MVRVYVGLLGGGKTYSMVHDAVKWFRESRPMIYSNMAGLAAPEAAFVHPMADFPSIAHGLLLLDETGIFFSSRFYQSIPREHLAAFAQMRKHGLDLLMTTQDVKRIDTVLREITGEIVLCRRIGRWIVQLVTDGTGKHILRRKMIRIRPRVGDLYDTLEVIGQTGAGTGAAGVGAVPLSLLARRRAAAERQQRQRQAARPPTQIYRRRGTSLELTKPARAALAWRRQVEPESVQGDGWAHVVRAEVERWRWLSVWGLAPTDVPLECGPASPWLDGWDPHSVCARVEAEAADRATTERRSRAR